MGRGGGIVNNGNLTLENLTIRDSNYNGPGGAVMTTATATLTVTNSSLLNNRSMRGSGIYQTGGTVYVADTIFRDSRATGVVDEGSAIRNEGGILSIHGSSIFSSISGISVANLEGGITNITDTLFQENGSGALYNEGADSIIEIRDSEFISNTRAIVNGGTLAITPGGIVTATRTSFTNNTASSGGAIANHNQGEITLIESLFSSNRATFSNGGAITNNNATLTILNSTFKNNSVGELARDGGAIHNERGGKVRIENSTFSGNQADEVNDVVVINYGSCAAINNDGTNSQPESPATLLIINSTFSGNSALREGGAICTKTSSGAGTVSTTIIHSTFTLNRVTEPRGGGAIYMIGGELILEGVIFADNTQGDENSRVNITHFDSIPGTVTSLGYNLSDTAIEGFGANDLAEAAANLGPLADNGGPTQTHALFARSLAIDARPSAGCPATDQRGVTRPLDGNEDGTIACDIGAFEVDEPLIPSPTEQELYLPQITTR